MTKVTNKMESLKWFLIVMVTMNISCQNSTKKEYVEEIKKEEAHLVNIESLLIIDDKLIEARVDTINKKLEVFAPIKDKLKDEEVKDALVILEAIKYLYQDFLEKYPTLKYNYLTCYESMKTIEFSISQGKESEKTQYKLDSLLSTTQKYETITTNVVKKIREVENEYHRKNQVLDKFVADYQSK